MDRLRLALRASNRAHRISQVVSAKGLAMNMTRSSLAAAKDSGGTHKQVAMRPTRPLPEAFLMPARGQLRRRAAR